MPLDNDKGDWRLQTTAHLTEDWVNPWTGSFSPKGTRLTAVSVIQLTKKKQLTIPIPNATAAMLNASARAYEAARNLRTNSGIDKTLKNEVSFHSETDALDYIERMIEAIVLAYSAIEAFCNESIPVDFVYVRHDKSEVLLEASHKGTVERFLSTDEKLSEVLPQAINCKSPKGSSCWEDYRKLKKVRDRIIHMKMDDRKSSQAGVDTIWRAIVLSPVPHLSAKKVIDHFVKSMDSRPSWHSRFLPED